MMLLLSNRGQTIWNMYQQLREDPRRRFALAYTIEDAEMRLWFCNRSEMLVSTPFNFITVSHDLRLIVYHYPRLTPACRVMTISCASFSASPLLKITRLAGTPQ